MGHWITVELDSVHARRLYAELKATCSLRTFGLDTKVLMPEEFHLMQALEMALEEEDE